MIYLGDSIGYLDIHMDFLNNSEKTEKKTFAKMFYVCMSSSDLKKQTKLLFCKEFLNCFLIRIF